MDRADLAGRLQRPPCLPREHPLTPPLLATVGHLLYLTSAGLLLVRVPHPHRWKRPRSPPHCHLCHRRRSRNLTSANVQTSQFSPANAQCSAPTRKSGRLLHPVNAPPLEHQTTRLPTPPQHQHHAPARSTFLSVKTLLSDQTQFQVPPLRQPAVAKRHCHPSPACQISRTPTSRCCSTRRRTS